MSTRTHAHRGAGPRARMPRHLSPRRTARIMGVRVTPRVRETIVGTIGTATVIGVLFDFDGDPTSWTPVLFQALGF